MQLLRRPFGTHGKVHEITPASAGWRYVGFWLYRLRAGETVGAATGGREIILVMVEGKARLTGAGRDWGVLGERMDVFEKTPPHCLYLPNGSQWEATAETNCVLAACSAPGQGGHEARRIGPDGITRRHLAEPGLSARGGEGPDQHPSLARTDREPPRPLHRRSQRRGRPDPVRHRLARRCPGSRPPRRQRSASTDRRPTSSRRLPPDLAGLAFVGLYDLVGPNLPVLEL